MHKEILSEKNRETLEHFLRTGEFTDRTLKFRIKERYSVIAKDFDLIQKAMQNLKES